MTETRLLFDITCNCGKQFKCHEPDELAEVRAHFRQCEQFRQGSPEQCVYLWIIATVERELRAFA